MSQPLLSAASILAAKDLAEEIVAVPEWGGDVRLVEMNAHEATEFSDKLELIKGQKDGMYLMLIYSAKDADGNRLFKNEDIDALRAKSMDVLNRLQLLALRLNKMDAKSKAALKKD